jgi:hypothetical protein
MRELSCLVNLPKVADLREGTGFLRDALSRTFFAIQPFFLAKRKRMCYTS